MRKTELKRLKRWHKVRKEYVCNQKANAFIEAILKLEKRHGLCIAHEDTQGSFVIVPYTSVGATWLSAATISDKL